MTEGSSWQLGGKADHPTCMAEGWLAGTILWPNTSLLFYGYFRELVAPFALQQGTALIWRCNELPQQASLQILLLGLCACKIKLHQNVNLGLEKIPGWETRRTFHHSWCLKMNGHWRCLNLNTIYLLITDMFSRKMQDSRLLSWTVLPQTTPQIIYVEDILQSKTWLTDCNFTYVLDRRFCLKAHELTDFLLPL